MNDQLRLRPVTEDDLPMFDRFKHDPGAPGHFEWFGWHKVDQWRSRWAENRLLTPENSTLVVAVGDDLLGFVNWRRVVTTPISYCIEIGIGLLPEGRGKGYGTAAQ